jgi:hypothetical protein
MPISFRLAPPHTLRACRAAATQLGVFVGLGTATARLLYSVAEVAHTEQIGATPLFAADQTTTETRYLFFC